MKRLLMQLLVVVFVIISCKEGFCHGPAFPNPLEYNQASCFKEEGVIVDAAAYTGATFRYPATLVGFLFGTILIGPVLYVATGFDSEDYLAGALFTTFASGISGNYLGQYVIAGPVYCIKKVLWDLPILIYHTFEFVPS